MDSSRFKFRAWNTKRKLYIGEDYSSNWLDERDEWWANEQLMIMTNINELNKERGKWNDKKGDFESFYTNNFIIEQCTGLRDSTRTEDYPDGKLIYEGDLLQNDVLTSPAYTVRYSKSELTYKLSALTDDGPVNFPLFKILNRMLVIGNIHENSELLKE